MREATTQTSERRKRVMIAHKIGKQAQSGYLTNKLVLLRLLKAKHHQLRRHVATTTY